MFVDGQEGNAADKSQIRAGFHQLALDYADAVLDDAFKERVQCFDAACADPQSLWRGDLGELPKPATSTSEQGESYTYFDHLVTEGSIPAIVGYLNRQRIKQRISALLDKRATGDLRDFTVLARRICPDIDCDDVVPLARFLLDAELQALSHIDVVPSEREPPPASTAQPLVSSCFLNTLTDATLIASVAQPLCMQALFSSWQQETKPSASTLSTWGGHDNHFKQFFGAKADDLASITQQDRFAGRTGSFRRAKRLRRSHEAISALRVRCSGSLSPTSF